MTARLLLTALIVLFAVWTWQGYRRKERVLEYAVLLRFPILLAASLVLLPLLSITQLSSLLENLMVLNARELGFVTFLAIKAAWVVLLCGAVIVQNANARFAVGDPPRLFNWRGVTGRARFILLAVLAFPIIGIAFARSPDPTAAKLAAITTGVVVVTLFFYAVSALRVAALPADSEWFIGLPQIDSLPLIGKRFHQWLSSSKKLQWVSDSVGAVFLWVAQRLGDGYEHKGKMAHGHGEAAWFFALAALVYLFGLWWLDPIEHTTPSGVWFYNTFTQPALGYVLVLMVLVGMMLSAVGFFFDRFRFPTLAVFLIFSLAVYGLTDIDHYYEVTTSKAGEDVLAPVTPVRHWVAPDGAPADVVVVAASGGGITAAYWTTLVLEGLQKELGADFARSIRMISAVSGGSVGAMYYVDGFTPEGPPTPPERPRQKAGDPSLAETTWGLVYPDFLRGLSLPFTDDHIDRGWATEQAWRGRLSARTVTLRDWRDGIANAWRPAPIFNATIANNGERFLISPLDLPRRTGARAFTSEFPGGDLPVTTAARLSATFPYVTPIARARVGPGEEDRAFHVADGGYYDNFGVVSAIEWLQDVLPVYQHAVRGYKVLIIQIRASNQDSRLESEKRQASMPRGWLYATLGPITTLTKVRTSTQIARNDMELSLLRDHWCFRGIELRTVVFSPQKDGPLSWQLTRSEQETIEQSWSIDGKVIQPIKTKLDSIAGFRALPRGQESSAQRTQRCIDQAVRERGGVPRIATASN